MERSLALGEVSHVDHDLTHPHRQSDQLIVLLLPPDEKLFQSSCQQKIFHLTATLPDQTSAARSRTAPHAQQSDFAQTLADVS